MFLLFVGYLLHQWEWITSLFDWNNFWDEILFLVSLIWLFAIMYRRLFLLVVGCLLYQWEWITSLFDWNPFWDEIFLVSIIWLFGIMYVLRFFLLLVVCCTSRSGLPLCLITHRPLCFLSAVNSFTILVVYDYFVFFSCVLLVLWEWKTSLFDCSEPTLLALFVKIDPLTYIYSYSVYFVFPIRGNM